PPQRLAAKRLRWWKPCLDALRTPCDDKQNGTCRFQPNETRRLGIASGNKGLSHGMETNFRWPQLLACRRSPRLSWLPRAGTDPLLRCTKGASEYRCGGRETANACRHGAA